MIIFEKYIQYNIIENFQKQLLYHKIFNDFNIKFSWDMKQLRGVDTGDIDTELVFSYDNAHDYTWVLR